MPKKDDHENMKGSMGMTIQITKDGDYCISLQEIGGMLKKH